MAYRNCYKYFGYIVYIFKRKRYTIYLLQTLILVEMAVMYIKPASWVEISKSAFDRNIASYKSIIDPKTKIGIVIKSNAYGHDTATMFNLCQHNPHIDYICTNSLSEALLARSNGVTKKMLVISLIDEHPELAITNNINLIGHSFNQIKQLNEIGARIQKPAKIHVKVDTGMSRLGFLPEELYRVIDQIRAMPFIQIEGVFTHFAESSKENTEFTNFQSNNFKTIIHTLEQKGTTIPFRHISNTAGIPQTTSMKEVNMIRMGAGAFGFYPSEANVALLKNIDNKFNLTPILSWKTRIMEIKKIPANRFVGYGRTYTTDRETVLGFLPIGYADGFDKKLSNKGVVYLSKQKTFAPIIGLICMNMTIIDLTDVHDVNIADEVKLIGTQKEICAQTIDKLIETENPRQVTSKITPNIPRIIVS